MPQRLLEQALPDVYKMRRATDSGLYGWEIHPPEPINPISTYQIPNY